MPQFDTPRPITVAIRLGGGSVDLLAEDRTTTTVDVEPYDQTDAAREAAQNARVEMHGNQLVIVAPDTPTAWLWRRSARLKVTARVPADSTLSAKVASADVSARGRYATVKLNLASSDAYVEHVTRDVSVNTASGDFTVDSVGGGVQANSASGDVTVRHVAGDANVHAASGDINLEDVGASVRANTASGDIHVGVARQGQVRLKSASGDITIGVAAGTAVWLDLSTMSGTAHHDLAMTEAPTDPATATVQLQARTMSGDIYVRRATAPAAAA
jgi:Putative adhesin